MSTWVWYAIGAAVLGLQCGCQRSQSSTEPNPALPSPASVQVVRPHQGEITRSITLPAEIRAYQQATLYAKVAGYLKTISVDKGDEVKEGALLAEIEVPELLADRAKFKAETEVAAIIKDCEAFGRLATDAEAYTRERSALATELTRLRQLPAAEKVKAEASEQGPKLDPETEKMMNDAFKNLRLAWKITAPFEVISSNATRKEGNTLIWEYDFEKLQKLASSERALNDLGVKVVYKK